MKQVLLSGLVVASYCSAALGSSSMQASIVDLSWADPQPSSRRLLESSVPRVIVKQRSESGTTEQGRKEAEPTNSKYTPSVQTQPVTDGTPSTPTSQTQYSGNYQDRDVPVVSGTPTARFDDVPEVAGTTEQFTAGNNSQTYPTTSVSGSTTPRNYQTTQQYESSVKNTAGAPTIPSSLPVRTQATGVPTGSSVPVVPGVQAGAAGDGSTTSQGNSSGVKVVSEEELQAYRSGQLGNHGTDKEVPSGGSGVEKSSGFSDDEVLLHSTHSGSSNSTVSSSEDDSDAGQDEPKETVSSGGWLTLPSEGSGFGSGSSGSDPIPRPELPSTRLPEPSYQSANSAGERKYAAQGSSIDRKPELPAVTGTNSGTATGLQSTITTTTATTTPSTPAARSRTQSLGNSGARSNTLPSVSDNSVPTISEDKRIPSVHSMPSDQEQLPQGSSTSIGSGDSQQSTEYDTPSFSAEDVLNDVPEDLSRYDTDDNLQAAADFNETMLEDMPSLSAEDTPISGDTTGFTGGTSTGGAQGAGTVQRKPGVGESGLVRTDSSSGSVVVDTQGPPWVAGGDEEEEVTGVGTTQEDWDTDSSTLRDADLTSDDGTVLLDDPDAQPSDQSVPSLPQKMSSHTSGAGGVTAGNDSSLPERLADGDDDRLADDEIPPPLDPSTDAEPNSWKRATPDDSVSMSGTTTHDDEPAVKGEEDGQLADDEQEQPATLNGRGDSSGGVGSLGSGGWEQQQKQKPSYDGVVGASQQKDPVQSQTGTEVSVPTPQDPDSTTTNLNDQEEPTFGGGWKDESQPPPEEDDATDLPRVVIAKDDSADVQMLRGGGDLEQDRQSVDTGGMQEQQPLYRGGEVTDVGADDSVAAHLVVNAGALLSATCSFL